MPEPEDQVEQIEEQSEENAFVDRVEEALTAEDSESTHHSKDQLRGANGKFTRQEDESAERLDAVAVAEAKALGFTDEQLARIPSDDFLQDMVAGRRARYLQRFGSESTSGQQQYYGQQTPEQQQAPAETNQQQEFADLSLNVNNDDLAEEVTGPLKQVESYVNNLKETLVAENQQLRQAIVAMNGRVEQSVQSSQRASAQQQLGEVDALAASIPGLVDSMGKPSDALSGGGQHLERWEALAGPVSRRMQQAMSQYGYRSEADVPREVQRAILESTAKNLGFLGSGQSNHGNGKTFSGTAVRGSSRQAVAEEPDSDWDRVKAVLDRQAEANGGYHPFYS